MIPAAGILSKMAALFDGRCLKNEGDPDVHELPNIRIDSGKLHLITHNGKAIILPPETARRYNNVHTRNWFGISTNRNRLNKISVVFARKTLRKD